MTIKHFHSGSSGFIEPKYYSIINNTFVVSATRENKVNENKSVFTKKN